MSGICDGRHGLERKDRMSVICLHDRGRIEAHLRREPYLNLYGLGDLDPGQWPFTLWFGLADGDRLQALALLYTRLSTPVLLALGGAADQLPPRLPSLPRLRRTRWRTSLHARGRMEERTIWTSWLRTLTAA
jgi:hypothetical protein